MAVLAIDTSNRTLSVALRNEEGQFFEKTIENTLQHSVQLMPAIEELLQHSAHSMKDVTKIVIAKGPGSYTGLRIGVTVAKTFAKALQVPLVPISSLLPLVMSACQEVKEEAVVVPFFDARRNHIFTGMYAIRGGNIMHQIGDEVYVSWESLVNRLQQMDENIYIVGSCTPEQRKFIQEKLDKKVHFLEETIAIPHATYLIQASDSATSVDADIFVPTYLKLAEAEENWKEAHPHEEESQYVERV